MVSDFPFQMFCDSLLNCYVVLWLGAKKTNNPAYVLWRPLGHWSYDGPETTLSQCKHTH